MSQRDLARLGFATLLGMSAGAGLTYLTMRGVPPAGEPTPLGGTVATVGLLPSSSRSNVLAPGASTVIQTAQGTEAPGAAAVGQGLLLPRLQAENVALSREVSELRQEVARLNSQLVETEERAHGDKRSYDLSPQQLQELAARCELRWDLPALGVLPTTVTEQSSRELGLSQEERQAANQVFSQAHRDLTEFVRKIYIEVTGDQQAGSLSATSMLDEILDKTPSKEVQGVFHRISRERAGLQPAPDAAAPQPPIERLFRKLTFAGNELESTLAEKLGPERARAYRDLKNGWDSQHRSSYGCP